MLTIQAIQISGVLIPDNELLAKLPPLHVGDKITRRDLSAFFEAVRQVDEHLTVSLSRAEGNNVTLRIAAPYTDHPATSAVQTFPGSIPVGARVQNMKLISHPDPVYPVIAKDARIQGTVELAALIGPDGHMQQLTVISGHPLLRQAALDAVKQWVYSPTLLNNNPTSVSTTIDVTFTLSQ
jgi:TonB family protein